jgi:hypothetical protein
MLGRMNTHRSGSGPDTSDDASWASETLPMAVRRELLERELNKLGARRGDRHGAGTHESASGSHDNQASHPQAGDDVQHGE